MKKSIVPIIIIILAFIFMLFLPKPSMTKAEIDTDDPIVKNKRTTLVTEATKKAKDQMKGLYSWEENRFCSSFVALYVKNLGVPVNWLEYGNGEYQNPFPWSNTVEQVKWARENYPYYVHDSTLEDFLGGNLWNIIKPGDVIYLTSPIGHNGYNTYYHNAILVGYRKSGSPVFAEIAFGIEASTKRTLEELTSFYRFTGTEPFYTGKSTPKKLKITWIDMFSIVYGDKENQFKSTKPHLIYK